LLEIVWRNKYFIGVGVIQKNVYRLQGVISFSPNKLSFSHE